MFSSYAPVYEAIGEEWVSLQLLHHIRRWLAAAGLSPQSAADLACGTGAAAVALSLAGLDVVGVDRSAEMLALARRRAAAAGARVTWLEQDLQALHLPQPVELITALYDSFNYLLSAASLRQVIERAAGFLQPGGVLAFDLNTLVEYTSWIGGREQVVHDSADFFVISRRTFDPDTQIASGRIIWMQRDDDRWLRGEEVQQQRAFDESEVGEALSAAGLRLREKLTLLGEPADEQASRILYLTQKH